MADDTLASLEPPYLVQVTWAVGDEMEAMLPGRVRARAGDQLTIQMIGEMVAPAYLVPDQVLRLQVMLDEQVFRAVVHVVEHDPATRRLLVTLAGAASPVQRRRLARVAVDLRATVALLGPADQPVRQFAVRLLDLGGGGARFNCAERLSPHDLIQMVLPLPGDRLIAPTLTVIDCEAQHGGTMVHEAPIARQPALPPPSPQAIEVDLRSLPRETRAVVAEYALPPVEPAASGPGRRRAARDEMLIFVDGERLPDWLRPLLLNERGLPTAPHQRRSLEPRATSYQVRGQFVVISEDEREQIIHYVASCQQGARQH